MSYEIIDRNGQRFVLVPEEALARLEEAAEDLADIAAYDRAKAKPQEFIPGEIVHRLVDGENPLRVWRAYRKLTQQQVAAKAGISKPFLSQLEHGERVASVATLQALATALGVDLDDISPEPPPRDTAPATKHRKATHRRSAKG